MAEADEATREVFESLPRVPDIFQNRHHWELQRCRYERTGQFPVASSWLGWWICIATKLCQLGW